MSHFLAERFPTLARHFAVLRASWAMQNEAARNHPPRSDHEFLPAALEIMEKPPSPGLRMLLLMTCAFFTIAVIWAIFGTVDVVAVASGKIIPSAKIKTIQPIEIGSVRAIHVRNGDHVTEGQVLVELDPTLALADQAQARQALLSADVLQARYNALLAYLDDRPHAFAAPAGASDVTIAIEEQFVRASIAEYEAQVASLRQQIAQHAAELATAQTEASKLRRTLPLLQEQVDARRTLTEQGIFGRLKLLDDEQQLIERALNVDVQIAAADKARASMTSLEAEIRKLRETFARSAVTELAQAADKAKLADEDLHKASRRLELLELRAPVAGTVQQLVVATVGGVVQPAQPLMVIVPDGAEIEVEAHVMNKDIGFVREGQPVRVKLEAFPFTDYGLVPGVVADISRDAIDLSQSGAPQRDEKGRPVQPGLVYVARIRLLATSIEAAGNAVPLGPGLSVQAEIKTGERRIIQYLLSPITQSLDEAGRER